MWEGDEDTVKEITLAPWGEDHENPLLVSARNHCKFSALDIAIGRGNARMIKLVIEIASIQFTPTEQRNTDEMISDSDSDASSMSGVEYDNEDTTEKAKETVDVREVAELIPSQVHPATLLQISSQLWRFLDDWKSHAEGVFQSRKDDDYPAAELVCIFHSPDIWIWFEFVATYMARLLLH